MPDSNLKRLDEIYRKLLEFEERETWTSKRIRPSSYGERLALWSELRELRGKMGLADDTSV